MIESVSTEMRGNPPMIIAMAIITIYMAIALFAPVIAPNDPNRQDLRRTLEAPSREYPLGTDEYGRDLLSRLIYATRSSTVVAVSVVVASAVIGTALGIFAGYRGGFVDSLLMRASDIMMAFPSLVLALGLIAAIGPGLRGTIIALAIAYTPVYARIVRGNVLSIKEEAYIESAQTIGVGSTRIAVRHVLPNVAGPVLVQGALTFAFAVLSEAGLSFVGLGVAPPTASFGNIIASGRDYISTAPWISTSSGIATVLIVLSLLILADGLRDALDPYQHRF
ncbi:MAG: ABC transporter permease [Thermomicrobiales bacterium]|nr:ABC transporter permease [Thermomicrobiales bacterium]